MTGIDIKEGASRIVRLCYEFSYVDIIGLLHSEKFTWVLGHVSLKLNGEK